MLAETFTYRSARSGALTAGLALAVVVETAVVHLWLSARHPLLAWTLTALGVASLLYLALEYRAWGRGVVRVTGDELDVRIGRRIVARVPRQAVASAAPATWRDLPDGHDAGYLNAMSPAEPNVLVAFGTPQPVRLAGVVTKRVSRLGLRLDDPGAFVERFARG